MFVEVHKGFALTRPYQVKVKDGFRKFHYEIKTEYCSTEVVVYCDESKVEKELEKAIYKELDEMREQGYNGFSFAIPPNTYKNYPMGITYKTKITYLRDKPITYAAEHLTTKQFMKFLTEFQTGFKKYDKTI